jgi:hypothetical protein
MQERADTTTPTETIPFDEAVAEIAEIQAKIKEAEYLPLRIGEIADKVKPEYGDSTMEKLAEKLGIKLSTLNHYRTVYRAWKDILPPGAKFPFAVLKELAAVPNRAELLMAEPNMSKRRAEVLRVLKDHPEIISAHPNLTCSNDAREIRSKYDDGDATWRTEPTEQAGDDQTDNDDEGEAGDLETTPAKAKGDNVRGTKQPVGDEEARRKEVKRVVNNLYNHAHDAGEAAADVLKEDPADLLEVVEERLVDEVRKRGQELIACADKLDEHLDNAAKKLKQEGHVQTTPKPASEPPEARA